MGCDVISNLRLLTWLFLLLSAGSKHCLGLVFGQLEIHCIHPPVNLLEGDVKQTADLKMFGDDHYGYHPHTLPV
ncbi:hypothetical protein EVAR_422_1 [Eumeta japonica]|uniref:Uncharacterized protein n=1 Tax=Eumeta variegata TaxID=151549 RepID=A0A4C1SDA7_EUMVA|nr:hypothetical protein EVAR_422_1 [Eumeta japonica]